MARFPIRIGKFWRLPLLIIRATPATAYVELGETTLELCFGSFRRSIDISEIRSVEPMKWRWIDGVGIRMGDGTFGLIGANGEAVAVHFRSGQSFKYIVTAQVTRLALSLEDNEGFIRALDALIVQPNTK